MMITNTRFLFQTMRHKPNPTSSTSQTMTHSMLPQRVTMYRHSIVPKSDKTEVFYISPISLPEIIKTTPVPFALHHPAPKFGAQAFEFSQVWW